MPFIAKRIISWPGGTIRSWLGENEWVESEEDAKRFKTNADAKAAIKSDQNPDARYWVFNVVS